MKNKILIVDDEPNNLDVLRNCLHDAGFKVMIATDGEKALKRVANITPDLILLDIMMPGMDGFETCRCLKQNEITKDIPIIFITAKLETFNKVEGLKMGAVDYITKPFQSEEVIARVNKHLTIHNLRKQLEAQNAQLEIQNTQLQNYVYHLESLATLGKAINETKNITNMMNKVMRVTLTVFKCDRAWLLYPCDPNAANWRVPIEATKRKYPGASKLNKNIPMEPAISKIMKNALSATGPIVFGPDYEYKVPQSTTEQFSVNSQLCLAIYPKIGKPWLFGIHQCSHTRIWTDDEIKLFKEFGQQIGVSLGLSISVEELHKSEKRLSRKSYHNFVGASRSMQVIYQTIDDIANSNASILISGETGTGKEICAEAIYKQGSYANKPFMICNCAVVPKDLLESYLFGHVKGAFTGAIREQTGLVEKANNGILFLDEIGELSISMQSSLLRFVQTKTFHKIGSLTIKKVNIRLICATHHNLLAEVKAGRFREDLFFRINTIEIKLPPLRERVEDIFLLAEHFFHKFSKEEQKGLQDFTPEAKKLLLKYNWPGNIRQLQGIIHNLVILSKGKTIDIKMLRKKLNTQENSPKKKFLKNEFLDKSKIVDLTLNNNIRSFEDIEKEVIMKVIEYCDGNVYEAAKLLGIGKTTLYRKQQQWESSK
ncbi:sigma 54-interacting transcriptional regulator [Candidatus Halobeggiatoa sp. HSG11]|nr:sigma 54-interacting transcriptional regulator [Candidatus Halobeggiatoa sp. HSG11]